MKITKTPQIDKMSSLISVIVPVYNSGIYISRCVESILQQTYPLIEIILVNDGSTDESPQICDEYGEKYTFIQVHHTPNNGASYARKKGLECCHGTYVTFIDCDDLIEPDYIEVLYSALQEQETLIAACDYIKHHENEHPAIKRTGHSKLLDTQELHQRFFHYDFWGFCGKVYHKSVFEDIYFPAATVNEDYVVMAQLFNRYKRIAYINIPLYHYMMHETSLSNLKLSSRMLDEWTNKLWCYRFYYKNAPEWKKHAEAQVAETCCKLISAIGHTKEYSKHKKEMQLFLQKHCISLLCNKNLLIGLKCMMVFRMLQ